MRHSFHAEIQKYISVRALFKNNKLVLKVLSHIGGRSSSSCQRDRCEGWSGMGEGLLVIVSSFNKTFPTTPTEPTSCLSIIWWHFLGMSSASLGGGATELRVKLRKLPWLLKQSRAVKGRLRLCSLTTNQQPGQPERTEKTSAKNTKFKRPKDLLRVSTN